MERPQQAITVQVQFPAIWLDEGDEFRRLAGYDVCLRAFRCHNFSSISPDHANAQGNRCSTIGTDWDEGCPHCSFWADNFNGIGVHLNHRDVTFVAISRAELSKIKSFKKRMGWSFKWVSSFQSDFNFDYQASFTPEEVHSGAAFYNYTRMDPYDTDREGISVFYKDESGAVFHTYSCYARGIDMLNGTYHYLDLVPKGRDEEGLEGPQDWVRYHDRYED